MEGRGEEEEGVRVWARRRRRIGWGAGEGVDGEEVEVEGVGWVGWREGGRGTR